ncbi:hypothetical protein [Kitasatospora purpeofusca]|uniref:hypothetical protein n=1 Tax=Kitasatospora purpeofusca TaxID=67352 RepID=UPI00380D27DC
MGGVGWVATALSTLIGIGALFGALIDQFTALCRKLAEAVTEFGKLCAAFTGSRVREDREDPRA